MKNPRNIVFIAVLLFFNICVHSIAEAQVKTITRKNIQFIEYPGFPDGNSTWGDIGYNPVTDAVYIGVTNHKNKIGFYEYAVVENKMILKGFIAEMANLRDFQWQGKIHTKLAIDNKGDIYFGTDGGESREEYLMNHPRGYAGGFIMKWDALNDQLTNLGMPMQYESIKDVNIDSETGNIYAITYPQAHFIVFNPATNEQKDLGRLASSHVPRTMFSDNWGNCYYVDWRQRLVKYEKSSEKLIFAEESLPAFDGTPGAFIITGITAYAKDNLSNVVYLVTYGAKVLAFHTQKNGIGKVEDLGAVFDLSDDPLWKPYVPNLNLGDNGKLYYIIGGHDNYVKENITLLMEFDPVSKQKKIVFEFPTIELSEVTGSDIKDKYGNLYFAGRKKIAKTKEMSKLLPSIDDDVSIPFMIKFNPEKELK